MTAVERYRACSKCGHVNEHRLQYIGAFGLPSFGKISVTCSVCGYGSVEPAVDAATPKPEVSDARLRLEFNTWRLGNPSEFESWLREQARIQGRNLFDLRR